MISKKKYLADGNVRRFLSDFIIRSEQFTRPYAYIYDDTLNIDGSQDVLQNGSTLQADWVWPSNLWRRGANFPSSGDLTTVNLWQVVDNSVLYYDAPLTGTTIWVEVATTSEEFGDTLTQPTVERAEAAAAAALVSEAAAASSATASAGSASESASSASAAAQSAAGVTSTTQFVGSGVTKGIQYMANESVENEVLTIIENTTGFSVDRFTLGNGTSLVLENNVTYKIL